MGVEFMEKVKKFQNGIYILVALILLTIFSILLESANKEASSSKNSKGAYDYTSNNYFNTEFDYNDLDKAELAIYDKYIAEQSDQILNQKIYIKIHEINMSIDESTATKKQYSTIAIDQNGNKWKIISDGAFSKTITPNIKIYGLFRGLEETEEGKMPILEEYTYRIDSDYINKDEYKAISQTYINSLKELYSKESFEYNSMEESVSAVDFIYKNKNDDIKIKVSVSTTNKDITGIDVKIDSSELQFSDVDEKFWHSVIRSYNNKITSKDADKMIVTATADAISKNGIDYNSGQPLGIGTYAFEKTRITIHFYVKQLEVRNNE